MDSCGVTAMLAVGRGEAVLATTALAGRAFSAEWPAAAQEAGLAELIAKGEEQFLGALTNDLNTAEARAAIFDVLRAVNSAADAGKLAQADADATLALLATFDSIFAVLEDRDAEQTKAALAWAKAEGRLSEASAEVLAQFGDDGLTDAAIDALVAERTQAKQKRNFARADGIRNELLAKGVVIEDSKDGVRWKRK